MKLRILLLVCIFLAQSLISAAQQVLAEISAETAAIDEPFSVVFTLRNLKTKKLYVPDFGTLNQLSPPSQSMSNTNVNGRITSEYAFIYTLSASRAGTYTIPAAYAVENGKKIYSKTLQIRISGSRKPGSAAPQPAEKERPAAAQNEAGPEMYLVVESSHDKVYLGQPVEISYCLYATGAGIYSFFNKDIQPPQNALVKLKKRMDEKKFEQASYRGKRMQKLVLLKFIVQPVEVGTLKIPASMLGVQLEPDKPADQSEPQDLMSMFFGGLWDDKQPLRRVLKGNSLSLPVLSLPGTGIPEGFKGAIGTYSFSASMPDADVKEGRSIAYTLKVKGQGNINLVSELPLKLPAGWEVFGPQLHRNVDDSTTIPAGEIDFVYSLIPHKQGPVYIEPQRFVFFDPEKAAYQVLYTDSIKLNVLAPDTQNVVEDIQTSAAEKRKNLPGLTLPVLFGILVSLAAAAGLLWLILRIRRQRQHKITRTGRAEFRAKIVALRQLPQEEACRELEKWLVLWAKERMGINDVYTNADLRRRFLEQGLDEQRTTLWLELWKASVDARYAPAKAADVQQWIEKAIQLSDY